MIRHGESLGCVLLDEEDGNPFFPVNATNGGEELLHESGGQTQGGFIEEEDFGPPHDAPSDAEHALFTAAQGPCCLVDSCFKDREEAEHPFETGCGVFLIPHKVGAQLEVFQHGHLWKQPSPFRHNGNAQLDDPVCSKKADGLVIEINQDS
jgi:hypothetical protein